LARALALLGSLIVLTARSAALGALIRVDPGGGGDAASILEAVLVSVPGDTIAVIEGSHVVDDVELPGGVTLSGGWNALFTARVAGSSHLKGGSGSTILTCLSGQGPATVVDGFEISGATDTAILCDGSSPTIINNQFHDNAAQDGGAIRCTNGSSPLIDGNHFHHNSATYGGAIRAHLGSGNSPVIRRNLFEDNESSLWGGAIAVGAGSALVEDNMFLRNKGGIGGAVFAWFTLGGIPLIQGNLLVSNTAGSGGGAIGLSDAKAIIRNNTMWGNRGRGACILYENDPQLGRTLITNNILAGSLQGPAVWCETTQGFDLECNCVYGNAGGAYDNCGPTTDLFLDPLLCEPALGDFHVSSNSPCAPTGTSCGQIGALGVACGPPVSVQAESWARIKGRYR
jgi:hypothetical protein